MSAHLAEYQFKPQGRAKLWWSIIGLAAVLLLLPTVINVVIPAKANNYEQLTINTLGVDWELPIVTESGAPVMCEMTSDDMLMKYWDCNGDTTVVTMMVENMQDPSNTMQRMVKATLASPVSSGFSVASSADDRAHVLVDPATESMGWWTLPVVVLSQRGSGDFEGLTAIAVVNGASNSYYAHHIWSSMAQDRGLSYTQELPLEVEDWSETPELEEELDPLFEMPPIPELLSRAEDQA